MAVKKVAKESVTPQLNKIVFDLADKTRMAGLTFASELQLRRLYSWNQELQRTKIKYGSNAPEVKRIEARLNAVSNLDKEIKDVLQELKTAKGSDNKVKMSINK